MENDLHNLTSFIKDLQQFLQLNTRKLEQINNNANEIKIKVDQVVNRDRSKIIHEKDARVKVVEKEI